MANIPKAYSPSQVLVTIADLRISGYGTDTFCKVEKLSEDVTSEAGTDGEVVVGYTADDRHRITITLLQSSSSNDDLSALRAKMRRLGQVGWGPLHIKDLNGRTIFQAPTCWLEKPPEAELKKTGGNRDWVFGTATLDRVDGGNNPI